MAPEITPDMSDEQVKEVLAQIDLNDQNAMRNTLKNASPRQVFLIAMPMAFETRPEMKSRLAGIDGTVLWVIEGEGGGSYAMRFGGGELKVSEGEADARSTVKLSVDTWKEIGEGKTNPQMAFMQGKMTIAGDMSFLIQLQSIMPQR